MLFKTNYNNKQQHQTKKGHIDFTIEVERSLRVLDGAVTILDASAGVEPQTIGVWNQSHKYKIPRIAYLNKMDKRGANFEMCIRSIESKLGTCALPVQIPIIDKERELFRGVVDLVGMRKLIWPPSQTQTNSQANNDYGRTFESHALDPNDSIYELARKYRVRLVEKLAQINENFAEQLLDKYQLNYETFNDPILLDTCIRESTLRRSLTPVFCGSSFKNIGVQPMIDGVVKYLPSPNDSEKNRLLDEYFGRSTTATSCLTCFKIVHDHQKSRKRVSTSTETASLTSPLAASKAKKQIIEESSDENMLAFVRVYSGQLNVGDKLLNMNKQVRETCEKIYIPYANQIKQVKSLSRGNIGVVSGLRRTVTGEYLTTGKQTVEKLKRSLNEREQTLANLMTMGVNSSPPVFFCSIETTSELDERRLNYALECLQREDPSINVIFNDRENLDQTIIQGMGQLHLDIVKDRLVKEYKLDVYFSKLRIAYKEVPTRAVSESLRYERKSLSQSMQSVVVETSLELVPDDACTTFDQVDLNIDNNEYAQFEEELTQEHLEAVNHGVRSALNRGVLLKYPIINARVRLNQLKFNANVSKAHISSAVYQTTMNALKKADCVIIQPLMKVEVKILLLHL